MPNDNLIFGQLEIDEKISDCPYKTPISTEALLNRFGKDATWRDVLRADRETIQAIPGFGSKTLEKLYDFMSTHTKYSFKDLL